MIFLDWLLRFHPIIIILLQGQCCYLDTGSWAKTEIMVVSQWLSLLVTWSHARGSLLFVGHQCIMSPVHPTADTEEKMPGYSGTRDTFVSDITNLTLIRTQTTDK